MLLDEVKKLGAERRELQSVRSQAIASVEQAKEVMAQKQHTVDSCNREFAKKQGDIEKLLGKVQKRLINLERVLRDLNHMVELGVDLAVKDKLTVYKKIEDTLKERREVKELLKGYMPVEAYTDLVTTGMQWNGGYTMGSPIKEDDAPEEKFYACRSTPHTGDIREVLGAITNSENKFPMIKLDATESSLRKLKQSLCNR